MSKKKKLEKKSISILKEVDKSLDKTYEDLQEEIEDYQIRLRIADQKARKAAKKAKKKHLKSYEVEGIKKKARDEVLGKMKETSFLDRIETCLNDIVPIVIVIARLVASLILAILSLDCVKEHISPEMLNKMNFVYKKAMAVS